MKLKHGIGERPLWSQLYDILENQILTDFYKKGDILPSEKELMESYQVSRVTVRKAMDMLLVAGLIERNRGIGTIVIKNDSNIATSFQSSFRGVKEMNHKKDRRVIKVTREKPSQEVQSFFGISETQDVLCLERVTYLDGSPVTHYKTYINGITGLTEHSDFEPSLYQILDQTGYRITSVTEKIKASLAEAEDYEFYNKNEIFAVVIRTRKGFSNSIPIEYTDSRYLADGYDLEIKLT